MKETVVRRNAAGTLLRVAAVILLPFIVHAAILDPGVEAPSFSIPSLTGERETLRMWCGKELSKPYVNSTPHIVIVSFWATYCKPCEKEIPELEKFMKKHAGENIKIFLISIDEKGSDVVAPFAKQRKYTLPILLDPYKRTAQRYGVESLPALFVIDPLGIIRYSSIGYKEEIDIGDILEKAVRAITTGDKASFSKSRVTGETVAVQKNKEETPVPAITPKQKWSAVARIECGTSPDIIAAELGASKEEIRKWYDELKKLALEHWDSQ